MMLFGLMGEMMPTSQNRSEREAGDHDAGGAQRQRRIQGMFLPKPGEQPDVSPCIKFII